ncbi:hypothetical protein CHRY9390_00180 [Chryseobacterium aquaeductus]|uniref:Uncharacterized protein n=1 Tax=Chryseobacterium aquaeductus TaxID=2675056 RepID=A0A9N8MF99_9FLAO|nr:hypothetical protein [Chryseobacterium aquaeductus]CAA7329541.1 hypothetical protein CHRY9390_00180 [Chryseobacterium potabilaquae]CAD7797506.1 hypothetical protein CHRY9390_00180 [Chryseobacterium aquaeductus]
MRKFILLIACIFGVTAFSQIKVLKNETLVEIGKENSVGLYKKDNRFTFNYQDVNTSNLNTFRSFSFLDVNGDVSELYKLVTDGFIDEPTGNVMLELPNDIIELHYEKNYGQPTVQFIQFINKNRKYVGKSQFLNKKQIDKIFGIGTTKAALYKKFVPKANTVTTYQNTQNQVAETPAVTKPADSKKKSRK